MKNRFENKYISNDLKDFFHFLLWRMGFYKDYQIPLKLPSDFSYPNPSLPLNENGPKASWINHSTFLFELFGLTFVTDPIWNVRCSPVNFLGPKRRLIPPYHINDLTPPHFLLVSHDHYDHLDYETMRCLLHKSTPFILTSVGVKKWFEKRFPQHCHRVFELNWWQTWSYDHSEDIKIVITAVPAQHFSGRSLWDKNHAHWCGFMIEFFVNGFVYKKCYFAGDTGYNKFDFKEIGKNFGPIDLSLIPIGCYSPKQFMNPIHICPEESVSIHLDVQSKLSIGGHWGTFKLSDESIDRPPYDLYLSMHKAGLPLDVFRVLQPGQWINW